MTSRKEEKSLWGVAVRGEGGIAGERRVVGVFFTGVDKIPPLGFN